MPIVIGVDLGTTKITSIAVDCASGAIVAIGSATNDAKKTTPEGLALGHSEWCADSMIARGLECLSDVTRQLKSNVRDVAGIGITGQQHGMVLVDQKSARAASPLINWQDRRSLQPIPGSQMTWLEAARQELGQDAWKRTGCWLQPGFMAVTLFELSRRNQLPANVNALFIMDYFASRLTGQAPVTEPSCAGSSGVLNVRSRNWDHEAIRDLGLPVSLFPEICEATDTVGTLNEEIARTTGLPLGTRVYSPIGDHQASFLGSVGDRSNSVLVNVGTGAQVAVYTEGFAFLPPIELRPCPCGGNLLSNVGLAGGWSFQLLEQFFQDVGRTFFQVDSSIKLYDAMNRIAEATLPGADGLRCDPTFSGTRLDPTVRGTMSGMSPQNLTAGHFARAVLEGMSRSLHHGYTAIHEITKASPTSLVAAGNGLRENPLLAKIVSDLFRLPMKFTEHREEAAFGAALVASVGEGIFKGIDAAAKSMIHTSNQASAATN